MQREEFKRMEWWRFISQAVGTLPAVELTDDEQQDCEAFIRSLTQSEDDGYYVIRKDLEDSFKRSIVALCLMTRAERFAVMSRPESAEEACMAAAKACAVYPLSIYFYDFACLLEGLQRQGEAKAMFEVFLRRRELERSLDPIQQTTLNQRDIAGAVRYAQQRV
jgi:hypothetical protein